MRDSLPSARCSPVCNVLRQWKTSLIPTYRVYRLYDTCVTCLKGFPVMSVRLASASSAESECLHCARDKHSPKLYSSANNMNPGIVPPELMVRFYTCTFLYLLCIFCLFVL